MMKKTPGMDDVMAAMRSGDLMQATRRIQALLGTGDGQAATPDAPMPPVDGDVIDLVPERVTLEPVSRPARAKGFAARQFRSAYGSITYRLHRPASLPKGAPLLIMLHGCTQSAADFAKGTRMNRLADAAGMAVLWPEQSQGANAQRCWRWFEAAHHAATEGEPALLLELAGHVADTEALDAGRWYVAGLSAGGAMAAVLGDCGDDRIAGVAVHSGLAAAAATTMAGGLGAMRQPPAPAMRPGRLVPTLILHGRQDRTVAPGNADALFEQAVARGDERLRIAQQKTPLGLRTIASDAQGIRRVERYMIDRAGHAWSGGDPAGSYADADGPDASALMLEFFAEQRG